MCEFLAGRAQVLGQVPDLALGRPCRTLRRPVRVVRLLQHPRRRAALALRLSEGRVAGGRVGEVGVSLDVDTCSVAAAGFDGVVRPNTLEQFATAASYDELLDRLAGTLNDRARDKKIATHGIGVSLPGLIDDTTQKVVFSANLPLLSGRALANDLSQATGLECVMVRDSHALCLSERLRGEARQLDNFVMLDLCTGVGMSMMVNGQIIGGQNGFAGEIGHSPVVANGKRCHCGNRGCLETVASQWALLEVMGRSLGARCRWTKSLNLCARAMR